MEIKNGIAYINGAQGSYDGKVKDQGARYGRNSYANFLDYLQKCQEPSNVVYPDLKNLAGGGTLLRKQ